MAFNAAQPYATVTTDAGYIYYLQGGVYYRSYDLSAAASPPAPLDYFRGTVASSVAIDTEYNVAGVVDSFGRAAIRPSNKNKKGISICDWNTARGTLALTSSGANSSATLDHTVLCNNKPTLRCIFSTATDTYIARYTFTNPLRLRDVQALQIPILISNNQTAGGAGTIGTPFQIWFGLSTGATIRANAYFNLMRSGAFQTYSYSRVSTSLNLVSGVAIATLDNAAVTITYVQIVQATTAAAAANIIWVGEIKADVSTDKARIVIRMDGEYSSQYTLARQVLNDAGFRASLALTNADIGTAGRMTEAQLDEMVNGDRHEPIHHTYNSIQTTADGVASIGGVGGYSNATQWPTARDIAYDIRAMWAKFKAKGTAAWAAGIGFMVWGYTYSYDNALATAVRQQLVTDAFAAAGVIAISKSTAYQSENIGGFAPPTYGMPIDPYNIIGVLQATNTDTVASVCAIVDQIIATKGLGVFTFHRFVTASPGSLEMLITDFAAIVAYIKTYSNDGDVIVAPFGETMNDLYGVSDLNLLSANNYILTPFVSSVVASGSAVALTTATVANVTSIALTAGVWDVTGVVDFHPDTTTTSTYMRGGSSTTSATLGAQDSYFSNTFAIATTAVDASEVIPVTRYTVPSNATTTVYLVAVAGFAISTMTAYGTIRATRVSD